MTTATQMPLLEKALAIAKQRTNFRDKALNIVALVLEEQRRFIYAELNKTPEEHAAFVEMKTKVEKAATNADFEKSIPITLPLEEMAEERVL